MATRQRGDKTAQSKAFVDAARELGTDERPEAFDEALRKIAKAKPNLVERDKKAEPRDRE